MEFRHHPDEHIYVDGFEMTLSEFLIFEPDYPGLSGEVVGFEYFPGVKYWSYKAKGGAIDGPGPIDEALLDGYIAKRTVYETAMNTPVPLTLEQLWDSLRGERDSLLTLSDWTQGNDTPLADEAKTSWAEYRRLLRDLPASTEDPANPTWPSAPE
jgi:hypothetical protein